MPEAFLCDGIRTPFGRFGGALARVRPDDLAAHVVRSLVARSPGLDPAAIEDVVLGCANQAGEDNRNVARMALLLAGLPATVPGMTVNRLCASGLEAVAIAARAIRAGEAELMLAGGVESMSRAPFVMGKAETAFARTIRMEDTTIGWRFVNPVMRRQYGTDSMPETAEHVAHEHAIAREDQDRFAARSQARTQAAIDRDFFTAELCPLDAPGGKNGPARVTVDEQPRPGSTYEALAALKPVVRDGGTVTAGNASSLNDGAAALLIAGERAAARHGLTPRARIAGYATAGVPPRVMGIGPIPATGNLLSRLGLSVADLDVIELNEAFAAQALAVTRGLGLPDDAPRVNPNGGAIALGHPLGASGARLALTALRALEETGGRRALITMCVGVGQGAALVIERL
jgi:3-oxoadipyl-CoA thiolase